MDQGILDAINKRLAELEKIHTRYQGPPGKPGKDAPPPTLVIGTVTIGENADAKIRTPDGTFFVDLCLPRGSDGRDGYSDIPGPAGRDGCDGVDGHVVIGQVVGGHSAVAASHVEDDVQIIEICFCLAVQKVSKDCAASKVHKVSAVLLVCVVTKANAERKVNVANKEKAVFKVNEVCKEKLVRRVRKESEVRQVPLAVLVLMVKMDCVGLRESQETLVTPLHKQKKKREVSWKRRWQKSGPD